MQTPQDMVSALREALEEEDDALAAVVSARARQAELLHQLRAAGVPTTHAVHQLVAKTGVPLPVRSRLKLAERLRKRVRRGTRRPPLLPAADGVVSAAPISSTPRAITPAKTEDTMGKVLKKRVTEEWIATDADEELDVIGDIDDGDDEDQDDESEEDAPTKRPTRRK